MENKQSIRTAVIGAAGFGTRFLPATKVIPKEMIPVLEKPGIQYLVEEVIDSGITEIIIVVRSSGSLIERHFAAHDFDTGIPLDDRKRSRLAHIEDLKKKARITFVEQDPELPYGNASPVLSAMRHIKTDEPFAYLFGDDMAIADTPVIKQLISFYDKHNPSAILAVQEVSPEEVDRYGTVKYKEKGDIPYEIEMGVEKAPRGANPSNKAQFGRFIFTPKVLEIASLKETGKDGELWVIDVLNKMAKEGEKVSALPIDGRWFTTGDPLHFLQTCLAFASRDPEMRDSIKRFIKDENLFKF